MFFKRHYPVKWNLKDLDRAVAAHGLAPQKLTLLLKGEALRTELLKALTDAGAIIFASAIHAYSNRKQILGQTKADLVGYSFGNLNDASGSLFPGVRSP